MADARIRRDNAGTKVLIEATKTKLILKAFRNLNVRSVVMMLRSVLERGSLTDMLYIQTFACALGFGLSSLSLQGLALFIPTISKLPMFRNWRAVETNPRLF